MKIMNRNDVMFGTVEAVKKIGISSERLRYWVYRGIVNPKYVQHGTRKFRRYSQEDIDIAILIKRLVDDEKYSLEGAVIKLKAKESLKDSLEEA